MPCHDKKLEASRRDFIMNDTTPDVDLVLTTSEWVEWIAEHASAGDLKDYIESLEPAPSVSSFRDIDSINNEPPIVLVGTTTTAGDDDDVMMNDDGQFFAHSSGGYADYIFRYASKHLYGFDIPTGQALPWKPVASQQKRVSARAAAAASRNFHSVSLYHCKDGTYSLDTTPVVSTTPVLSFAIAYGVQTLQRIFSNAHSFDYVEAMACPSGCANGGGQVRLDDRETPAQTRQRVAETKQYYYNGVGVLSNNTDAHDSLQCQPFDEKAQRTLHTRYHVVPPLQHTLGAAAGVAVQDTQW